MEFEFDEEHEVKTDTISIQFKPGYRLYAVFHGKITYDYNGPGVLPLYTTNSVVTVPGNKTEPKVMFPDGNLYRVVEERLSRLTRMKRPESSLGRGTASPYMDVPKNNKKLVKIVREEVE